VIHQELREQPYYQPLLNMAADIAGVGQSITHGATLGFDEIVLPAIAAGIDYLRGKPFTKTYEQDVEEMRQPRVEFRSRNPATAGVAEEVGAIAGPAKWAAPLFAPTRVAAPAFQRAVDVGRNLTASAGLGGLSGFGMTEGDLQQRVQGAEAGAVLGTVAGVVAPAVSGVARSLAPGRQVERKVGETLLGQTGGTVPTMQQAPIPNFPLGVGGASNEPGLAAIERRANTLDNAAAVQQRTGQSTAVREAATTAQPGGTRLATGEMPPEIASANYRQAMIDAHNVIKQEEERLWTKPTIAAKQVDMLTLKQSVDAKVNALPARFRGMIDKTPGLRETLDDLANLPPNATLADVNWIRSDLLGIARGATEPFARKVAQTAADAVLTSIESNPALRKDPAAWADYLKARSFTARKWDVIGEPVFQNMIKTGADERKAASTMFGVGGGAAGERIREGTAGVTDMLDSIRRQWGALRAGGVTSPGTLDPSTAFGTRVALANGARDFIVNSMLDAVSSVQRGITGNQEILLNKLSDWIDTHRAWIGSSRLFNADQLALLDRVKQAAVMGARPENLRGGTNSATYERLMNGQYGGASLIDLFTHPLTRLGAGAIGGTLGAYMGSHVEATVGAILGMEGMHFGPAVLQWFYRKPIGELTQMLNQAIRDPVMAADLMRKADPNGVVRLSERTRNWLRSWLATEPGRRLHPAFEPALEQQRQERAQ
jgi:hypothetical protein